MNEQQLSDRLHAEADRYDVRPPPTASMIRSAHRSTRRRIVVIAAAATLVVAAVGTIAFTQLANNSASDVTDRPTFTGPPVMNVGTWQPGDASPRSHLTVRVVVDASGCVYGENGGDKVDLVWPAGFTAKANTDGGLVIADGDDKVKLGPDKGYELDVEGRIAPESTTLACHAAGAVDIALIEGDVVVDQEATSPSIDGSSGSEQVTQSDRDVVDAFTAFAKSPDEQHLDAIGLAPTISLGLGDGTKTQLARGDAVLPAAWVIQLDGYAAATGTISPLDLVTGSPTDISVGTHPVCVGNEVPLPTEFANMRLISIEPRHANSCLQWFSVDLFVGDDGEVDGVIVSLFEP